MPKKLRVRRLMDSQHVKVSERLFKSFDHSERKSGRKILFW